MMHTEKKPVSPIQSRAATDQPGTATASAAQALRGTAQRTISMAIQDSPRAALQRRSVERLQHAPASASQQQRLSGMFGAVAQRRLLVHGVSVTKHNFGAVCEKENGKLHADWLRLTPEQQEQLMPLINSNDLMGTQDTFEAILQTGDAQAAQHDAVQVVPVPQVRQVALGDMVVTAQVLNDSGGYHVILQHPNSPSLVIRARKDPQATSVARGMQNLDRLARRLAHEVGDAIRTPAAMVGSPDAYIVEKVPAVVDAFELWQQIQQATDKQSPEYLVARKRLLAIQRLVQANLAAAKEGETQPFPDFRPANVGVKDGAPELIYIDFDQEGEVTDFNTVVDQTREWAGRRYQNDPGGPREMDPALFKFLTGQG